MEQTVSGNAGAYTVPLGGSGSRVQRRVFPQGAEDHYDQPDDYEGIYDLHYDDK